MIQFQRWLVLNTRNRADRRGPRGRDGAARRPTGGTPGVSHRRVAAGGLRGAMPLMPTPWPPTRARQRFAPY